MDAGLSFGITEIKLGAPILSRNQVGGPELDRVNGIRSGFVRHPNARINGIADPEQCRRGNDDHRRPLQNI